MKTKTFFRFFLLGVMTLFTLGAWAQTTPDKDYLCFTAEEAGATVQLKKQGTPTAVTIEYRKDEDANWTTVNFSSATTTGDITLTNMGDKVYFRNTGTDKSFSQSTSNYYQFIMSGKVSASGNVMSLVNNNCTATTIPSSYCFYDLFKNCTSLIAPPGLPATTITSSCYREMFQFCTNLTTAPALPAETLAGYCYENMFDGCENLITAPELPATTMITYCYSHMFEGCKSLTTAPALPAETLADYCYSNMFKGCESLITAPALPATTLTMQCYDSMFYGCKSLITAPALPATTLKTQCYGSMFYGCESLTTAPELPATTMTTNCYSSMFYGCESLTTAPALPATTLSTNCYSSMFYECKSLTTAPELPATTLKTNCYKNMFYGCEKLNSVKVAFTKWENTSTWLQNIAATGTFVCPAELETNFGASNIPEGWSVTYDITANQDPNNKEDYYATFFTSRKAYQLPDGVTAYTGVVEESTSNPNVSVLKLSPITDGIIPASEGVVLKLTSTDDTETKVHFLLEESEEAGTKDPDNALTGTNVKYTATIDDYALSLGTDGVGFYKWEGKEIGAHKAYLTLSSGAKAFVLDFDEGTTTAIESLTPTLSKGEGAIYNLNGVRVDDSYKGIVIKNGKKVLVK